MSKKKFCKRCKLLAEGDTCPQCRTSTFTNNWQGRVYVTDPGQSMIAQKIGYTMKGEYAIKIR
ncbi:MAG TPA: transcription elongation factor subunit Spt4 [Candidatus Nanoarchaeia archaeon]|nr:transcription elongation factor subunit Spt4 [Candidatus Nanoarchaeia archaeon]